MEPIVVGYDGSEQAMGALRWAAAAGDRHQADVLVVQSWNEPIFDDRPWAEVWEKPDDARAQVDSALADAVASVARDHPAVSFKHLTRGDRPAETLVEASEGASMVVVGARGRGGFARLRLGSVGRRVASEASSPVVVVHPCAHPDGPVVVGVDGLPSAGAALLFAADEARSRGVGLRVVMAWSYWLPETTESLIPRRAEYTVAEAHRALRSIVDDVLGADPGVEVELEAPFDLGAKALIERSADAALLVVGPRDRSLRHRIDLGSVTAQILRHAECPVAVVRER